MVSRQEANTVVNKSTDFHITIQIHANTVDNKGSIYDWNRVIKVYE